MSLLTVEQARSIMVSAIMPLGSEAVPLSEADGRWLTETITAGRDQPPFSASAMDGWAIREADAVTGRELLITGESAAGHGLRDPVQPGQAVRIFTGAPLPLGAERVVLQEDTDRKDDHVTITGALGTARHIRPRGGDFVTGQALLAPGQRVDPWHIALAAASGHDRLICGRRPRIKILATGSELVEPGQPVGHDQIFNSGTPSIAAFVRRHGGIAGFRPAMGDRLEAIEAEMATDDYDLLVTIGGASVGDHDLVKPAALRLDAEILVNKVALKPGKPVWFARFPDGRPVLGLPGNPASGRVCAELFLAPVIAALQSGVAKVPMELIPLAAPMAGNGPRDHYVRAEVIVTEDGQRRVRPFPDQDSSLVTVMAAANALIRRPPHAPAMGAGERVQVLAAGV